MFLPLGDEPNPRGVPWTTYGLIAVNIAAYVLVTLPLSLTRPDAGDPQLGEYLRIILETLPAGQISASQVVQQITAYDLFVFGYGFRPAAPELLALVTSMFLHAGFVHLAGNMLFLWIYGDNVEHRLGSPLFLLAYLVTGIGATLFHTAFDLDSGLPLVGASGAISGVLGFYFIWFPRNRVRLWVLLFPFFMNVVTLPARVVLGFYLVFSNIMPFLVTQGMPGGGVAYGAHIGGFLAGLGWAWWADRRKVSSQPAEYRQREAAAAASAGEVVAAMVEEGRFSEAAAAYFRLGTEQARQLLTPGHSIALGDWLARHRHAEAALIVYQRHLRDYPLSPGVAATHLGAGLVQLHALRQPAAAYQHLVEVFDHDPDPETGRVARAALDEIASRQKSRVH